MICAICSELEHLDTIYHVEHLHLLDLLCVQSWRPLVVKPADDTGLRPVEKAVHGVLGRVILQTRFGRLHGLGEGVSQGGS
jgi:hypothetical protein